MSETPSSTIVSSAAAGSVTRNYPSLPENAGAGIGLPNVGISPVQRAAIELLVLNVRCTAAAEVLGISRKTLYNWRTGDADFRAALAARSSQVLDLVTDELRPLLETELDTLKKQLRDNYGPISPRTARTLLSLAAVGQMVGSLKKSA